MWAVPPATWSEAGVPVLAIEVISPTSAPRDRGTKRRIYQQAGVGEYWIVDVDARIIERWHPEDQRPEIVHERLTAELPGGVIVAVALADVLPGPMPTADSPVPRGTLSREVLLSKTRDE